MLQGPALPQRLLSVAARGRALADLLAGSWRDNPQPTFATSDTVELAIRGGSGALALRRSANPPSALRDLQRHQVLEAARFEHGIAARLRALREIGISPLLVKGWAIARRYPQKGLRHYSDIDLCVAPSERARAEQVMATHAADRLEVDLHFAIPHVAGRNLAAIESRIVEVPLADVTVRTLGDEDHLWLLALHALGHGLWRSVWLVDLAVLLEARGASLDWDYLFAGSLADRAALRIALALAHRVLGADVAHTPIERVNLPSWTEPALLEQWGQGQRGYVPLTSVPKLGELFGEARRRWPNAIRATAELGGPWNEWPRLPLQLYEFTVGGSQSFVARARRPARHLGRSSQRGLRLGAPRRCASCRRSIGDEQRKNAPRRAVRGTQRRQHRLPRARQPRRA